MPTDGRGRKDRALARHGHRPVRAPLPRIPAGPGALALLEVIDRDGHVRQVWPIHSWPAARRPRARQRRGAERSARRGAPLHPRRHRRGRHRRRGRRDGERHQRRGGAHRPRRARDPGRRCRCRSTSTPAAPACACAWPARRWAPRSRSAHGRRGTSRSQPTLAMAALVLAGLAFNTYLESDPDNLVRAARQPLLRRVDRRRRLVQRLGAAVEDVHPPGPLRLAPARVPARRLALLALSVVPGLFAFAFSWPWLTDFAFVATSAVAATALYFHLLAVEPARPRLMRWVVATGALVGIALSLWFNVQRTGQLGEELYMSHLFPPALRLARPLPVETLRRAPRAAAPAARQEGARSRPPAISPARPQGGKTMTSETRIRPAGRRLPARCSSPAAAAASAPPPRCCCAQQGWAVAVNYAHDARPRPSGWSRASARPAARARGAGRRRRRGAGAARCSRRSTASCRRSARWSTTPAWSTGRRASTR